LGSRFSKANQPARGYGCPFLRDMSRIRSALFKALTDERVEEMVAALVAMVKDGDLSAARFLFRHCIGPGMTFNVNPDDTDLLELERLRAQGQADAMGNSRLTPEVALLIEKVYADLAAAEAVAQDLDDGGTGLGRRLLAALRDAGMADLVKTTAPRRTGHCNPRP
jgi:hypothetical protein